MSDSLLYRFQAAYLSGSLKKYSKINLSRNIAIIVQLDNVYGDFFLCDVFSGCLI
ncbi:hypothetical protein [Wielerella bovis]|uniref:hypothetical protein n=1 Tax=Wielerella bovis TaxID=2917790 RepID=UPI0020190F6E|nr:hypothetical protein [Wielerella bovis]ULJ60841.1 hypothetical protein MIS44_02975 [Wielerella bovis]